MRLLITFDFIALYLSGVLFPNAVTSGKLLVLCTQHEAKTWQKLQILKVSRKFYKYHHRYTWQNNHQKLKELKQNRCAHKDMTKYKINYKQIWKFWSKRLVSSLCFSFVKYTFWAGPYKKTKMEKNVYTYERLHSYILKSMCQTLTCACVYTYKHMYIYGKYIFMCLLKKCCSD